MARHPFRILAHSEEGSISVLITSLFLLVFTLSVGIIDISDSYLAKRELIQIGEDAILVASHTLNENLYYSDSQNYSDSQSFGTESGRVPIDCALAELKFHAEITQKDLRENDVLVSRWHCTGDAITASITSKIQALVNFPILSNLNNGNIEISAIIGATSELSNNV